jgi:Kef-type K+ transport system membrane component KefB
MGAWWDFLPFAAGTEDAEILPFLLLDLAIIIVAARVLGSAARRIGQPAVIGEITAGILMGPTILGRFNESWPTDIFPENVPLGQIADLGLILFMFFVGLEIDHNLLRREGRRAAQISLSGIALPLVLGIGVGYAVYDVNLGGTFFDAEAEPAGRAAFAVFIGAAMCITAFPILARILLETGLSKKPIGGITLTAGAVDDVAAWLILAGVVGTIENGSLNSALVAFVLTGIFAALMFLVARRVLAMLASRYEARGHLRLNEFALIVAGLLMSAWVTEEIGIHSIFGAFLFGAIMPRHERSSSSCRSSSLSRACALTCSRSTASRSSAGSRSSWRRPHSASSPVAPPPRA